MGTGFQKESQQIKVLVNSNTQICQTDVAVGV